MVPVHHAKEVIHLSFFSLSFLFQTSHWFIRWYSWDLIQKRIEDEKVAAREKDHKQRKGSLKQRGIKFYKLFKC